MLLPAVSYVVKWKALRSRVKDRSLAAESVQRNCFVMADVNELAFEASPIRQKCLLQRLGWKKGKPHRRSLVRPKPGQF
jgi:hypothetical protein